MSKLVQSLEKGERRIRLDVCPRRTCQRKTQAFVDTERRAATIQSCSAGTDSRRAESMVDVLVLLAAGQEGRLGLYALASRLFLGFALLSMPVCFLIGKPIHLLTAWIVYAGVGSILIHPPRCVRQTRRLEELHLDRRTACSTLMATLDGC